MMLTMMATIQPSSVNGDGGGFFFRPLYPVLLSATESYFEFCTFSRMSDAQRFSIICQMQGA